MPRGEKFLQSDLGQQPRGATVRVTLSGNAANVRLIDSSNFSAYRNGRAHRYAGGGLVRRSPVDLVVPRAGHWYVIVDMQGLRGQTRANVQVLPGPLPEFRQAPQAPLAPIRQAVESASAAEHAALAEKEFDVFISHATEDKESVVRPLAYALKDRGLEVWYDEFELRLGDSLRRKIDAGLARSRFGVVVLSHAFFAKNWPQYELDGLVTREMTGEQIILPLWHNISKDEIVARSPSLADKVARRTSDASIEEIADEIAGVVREDGDDR